PSVQEVNRTVLVSVLDLDNTFFSAGRRLGDRGNSPCKRSLEPKGPSTKLRSSKYLCVDYVSLYTMSIRLQNRSLRFVREQTPHLTPCGILVGRGGLEPPTSRLSG
ncbi:unnamed protein product, partial [Ectocarpus sp. 12 AP-2014]